MGTFKEPQEHQLEYEEILFKMRLEMQSGERLYKVLKDKLKDFSVS